MKILLTIPIRLYQIFISPWFGRNCRYFPTCSHYATDALHKHGLFRGGLLGLKRILSCHPWCKKDMDDPVPERFAWKDIFGYKNPSEKKN